MTNTETKPPPLTGAAGARYESGGDFANRENTSNNTGTPGTEDRAHAEYVTGSFFAYLTETDEDELSGVDPQSLKALRKWWRKYDHEQPQSWSEVQTMPVHPVAEYVDTPTRREVAEDAAERGDDDPHDVAARLKSERAQRMRDRKADAAEGSNNPHTMADRVLSISGLAQLPPPTALVDGFLYRGTLAQLAGHPGDGKTFAAMGMSCAVALGRNWNGAQVPEALPVVYVAAEGSTGLFGRVAAWCSVHGVNVADLEGRLHVLPEPVQLGESKQIAALGRIVRSTGAGLVVLDTRARCTLGLEENSATEQGLAVAAAERLVAATGTTVLVVHHLGAASQRGRGSTAWDGAVYSNLVLSRESKDETRVVLRCDKHKDAPDGCKHEYKLEKHTVGPDVMPGADERRRSSLVLTGLDPLTVESSPTTGHLLDLIAETCGPDGLTADNIAKMAAERDLCKRSTVYSGIKALRATGQLVNVGTKSRPRYAVPEDE